MYIEGVYGCVEEPAVESGRVSHGRRTNVVIRVCGVSGDASVLCACSSQWLCHPRSTADDFLSHLSDLLQSLPVRRVGLISFTLKVSILHKGLIYCYSTRKRTCINRAGENW